MTKIATVDGYFYANHLQRASSVCLKLGLFTFVPHLVSIGLAIDIVARGYIRENSRLVLICIVIEILCWMTVPISFIFNRRCLYNNNEEPAIPCHHWTDWPSIAVWICCLLIVGNVRVYSCRDLDGIDSKRVNRFLDKYNSECSDELVATATNPPSFGTADASLSELPADRRDNYTSGNGETAVAQTVSNSSNTTISDIAGYYYSKNLCMDYQFDITYYGFMGIYYNLFPVGISSRIW